jgi:hypothetical protein
MCLRLTKLVIPPFKFRGDNAILECNFELNGRKDGELDLDNQNYQNTYNFEDLNYEPESLYSVKWYKDNEEFYRYVPKANPPQNSYKVDGIRVDVSMINLFIIFNGNFELLTALKAHEKSRAFKSFQDFYKTKF